MACSKKLISADFDFYENKAPQNATTISLCLCSTKIINNIKIFQFYCTKNFASSIISYTVLNKNTWSVKKCKANQKQHC